MADDYANALEKSGILDELWANPKTRGPLAHLLKQQRPDLQIPEVDIPAQVDPRIRQLEGQVKKMELKERYGLDDAGIAELATEMKQRGISNPDTAMELRKLNMDAQPRNSQPSPFQVPDIKELFNSPARWARDEANRTINELNRNRGRY